MPTYFYFFLVSVLISHFHLYILFTNYLTFLIHNDVPILDYMYYDQKKRQPYYYGFGQFGFSAKFSSNPEVCGIFEIIQEK